MSSVASPNSSKLGKLSFKFIPYLPQDAGYKVDVHLKSNIIASSLSTLNDDNVVNRIELLEIMNDDLSNLLKMSFRDFIQTIARDDVQKYICTFLQFSRRITDNLFKFNFNSNDNQQENKGNEGGIDMYGIDEKSQSIRHKIFLIIYRLTNKQQILTQFNDQTKYADLIYNNYLFDIPRLLDFTSIYYFANTQITKQIITNIFTIQPKYNTDLDHAMQIIQRKCNTICNHYHKMDPDLKLSINIATNQKKNNNNNLNKMNDLINDINLIKEILINWYTMVECYDYLSVICNKMDVLSLLVIMVDTTFPLIQEQLNQFNMMKLNNNNSNALQLNQYHPSIVISTRLCLNIVHSIIGNIYKPLFDDMNGNNNNNNNNNGIGDNALELCAFLNNITHIGADQSLNIAARRFIEVGSFARKLFGTFKDIQKLLKYLLSKGIINVDDIGLISHNTHLMKNISPNVLNKYNSKFSDKKDDKKSDGGDVNDKIVRLMNIFPDHSDKYFRKLLEYFSENVDAATTAILDGTVPTSIESIDDDDIDDFDNDLNTNKSVKSNNKNTSKTKKQKKNTSSFDDKLQDYMKFTGRTLKKDDDEEFYDIFGKNDNKNKRKKFNKILKKTYNMYQDDLDDSYLQYKGFDVDDEHLSMSDDDDDDDDGDNKGNNIDFIDKNNAKNEQIKIEQNAMLNTQLNKHSYKFIPHNKPQQQSQQKQSNKFQKNNVKPYNKNKNKNKNIKKSYNNNNKSNNNDNNNQMRSNDYRNQQNYQPQQYGGQQRSYNQYNDNYGYNDQYQQYNDNRQYNSNYNHNNNNNYGRGRGGRGGNNYRGRGRGGGGGIGGRGRGRGRGGNAYRKSRHNSTKGYRRQQAHKKYARMSGQ